MPDEDGYPTEEELKILKDWDAKDIQGLLDFLKDIWWESGWGYKLRGKKVLKLELHTGGWSGNEEIIGELQGTMFWALYWQKTLRGGHYYFIIKPIKD
jgi:hypothetical protein